MAFQPVAARYLSLDYAIVREQQSLMPPAPLRFVVLCDSLHFERWQAQSIREAVAAGVAVPVGVVIREADPPPGEKRRWARRWQARQLLVWRLFDRFYTRRRSRAIVQEDLSTMFADVANVHDTPVRQGKFGEALGDTALEFVKALQPDFVLRFSYGILRGDILDIPTYGVWSYHHGDPAKYRGQPPGFWEIAEGSPVVGSILQVLSDELDGGRILWQGTFQTRASSYVKTRDTMYLGSAPWLRSTCAAILATGRPPAAPLPGSKGRVYRQPDNRTMVRFLWKTVRAFVASQVTYRFYRQDWNCGVIAAPIADVSGIMGADRQALSLQSVTWMQPPRGEFYADPFGHQIESGPAIRLFFERLPWRTKKGEIATATFSDGRFGETHCAMSAETHLSYPFTLEIDGRPFFVPEHAAARNVSRFATDQSGTVTSKVTMFAHMPLIDTTFVEWEGKTWAFATMETASDNTDLFLFHADSLDGPWRAHPLNPVKSDVRSARTAGTPFVVDGRLYRPAQDCSTHYGSAITINEVVTLSDREFEERSVARVAPPANGKYPYGLHTISQVGGVTLIDGARKRLALS